MTDVDSSYNGGWFSNEHSFIKLSDNYVVDYKRGSCVKENVAKYYELCRKFGKENFELVNQVRERIKGFDTPRKDLGETDYKRYAYHLVIFWRGKNKIIDCANGRQEITDIDYWWRGRREWHKQKGHPNILSKFITINNIEKIYENNDEEDMCDAIYNFWMHIDKLPLERVRRCNNVTITIQDK